MQIHQGQDKKWMSARAIIGWSTIFAFTAVFAVFIYLRLAHLVNVFGEGVNCHSCIRESVLAHDLPYVGGIFFCLLAGFALPFGIWAVFFRGLALAGMLIYGVDFTLFRQLASRLYAADVFIYAAQPEVLYAHLKNTGLVRTSLALVVMAVCLAFLFWPWRLPWKRKGLALLAMAPAAVVITGLSLDPGLYVHDWAIRNVVEVNFNTGVLRPYDTPEEILAAAPPPAPFCAPGNGGGTPSLIVLIIESWSLHHSALFGGINDWTPKLDQIARANRYYMNMYASGFTTNEGLMGILEGMELQSPMKDFYTSMPFENSWGQARTLPRLLAARGYRSAFFTSGNLTFTLKDKWVKDIGFDHIEGHDHPSYAGHPRLHFEAVPDEILYQRVLDYLHETEGQGPQLIAIETVSSHHPFIHPFTRERNEEEVLRYVDQAASDFYDALAARGFLEKGSLFIISDHRAMIPVRMEERARFGHEALARIPAIWAGVGANPAGRVDQAFHQADLLDTVEWNTASTDTEVCSKRGRRDMLHPEQSTPRCLYHARGDSRDLIYAFCPEGKGTIRLAGNDTAMQEWTPAPGFEDKAAETSRAAVAWLNRYRIERGRHHEAWSAKNDP